MAINILVFTLSVCFSTSTLLYSYIPSAHFSPARPQKNNMPFSLCATPSDDPIAQICAARRNHSNYHKKNNHSAYFNSLEHALAQQCHTPYYQKRCQALDKTRNHNKRVKRTTQVNHDITTFAQKYDISPRDLTHTKFNHYEHQLHKEFLEQLSVATELKHLYQHADDYNVFIDAIGHGIALGVEANHHKESITATYWADVIWQTIDIAKAVGEGIGLGIYNTAAFGAQIIKGVGNAALYPIQTVRTIARGIDTVLSFFVPNFDKTRHKVNVYQELDALNERIACIAHHCSQQLSHMSLHDKVKFTSAFATEIVAPAKIFKVAQRLCKRMRPLVANALNIVRDEQYMMTPEGLVLKVCDSSLDSRITRSKSISEYVSENSKRGSSFIKITNKQALEMAQKLGFKKTNFYSHGHPVFQKGNKFITIDVDSHNGGIWKMANSVENLASKRTRLGTYDKNLNKIGD